MPRYFFRRVVDHCQFRESTWEVKMPLSTFRCWAIAALMTSPAFALAGEGIPVIKGQWIGKTHTIIAGRGGHWPNSTGTFTKPALLEKDLVIDITEQDGRRFWGVTTISGHGETTTEPFIGQLAGQSNPIIAMADTDGYFNGQFLDDHTLAFCYMHAGGKNSSTVVSCVEVKRQR
jgi:hypothetical protein